MAQKTQGTELWFQDPDSGLAVKVGCITSFTGGGSPADQIDVTCMDSDAREFVAGMKSPGQSTFGINFDMDDTSHLRLNELFESGEVLHWAVGWGDFTPGPPANGAPPTTDSSGFVTPTSRSWILFDGYVADIPLDAQLNGVWTSTVALQVSGARQLVPRA